MFEVGASELFLVGLVALMVIGPEKLPQAARLAGFWLGKGRSIIANVQAQSVLVMQAEEVREQLARELKQQQLQDLLQETDSAFSALQDIQAPITPLATLDPTPPKG